MSICFLGVFIGMDVLVSEYGIEKQVDYKELVIYADKVCSIHYKGIEYEVFFIEKFDQVVEVVGEQCWKAEDFENIFAERSDSE